MIEENNDRLRHLCRIYAPNRTEEKDLFQEIVIQLWRSLPQFEGNAKLSTWLYRVALNVSISFARKLEVRRKHHRAYRNENIEQYESHITPGETDPDLVNIEQLYQAISKLNISEKALITMYLENFSYAEIAEITHITENYVGVKLNRIKKKLTQIIEKNYGI